MRKRAMIVFCVVGFLLVFGILFGVKGFEKRVSNQPGQKEEMDDGVENANQTDSLPMEETKEPETLDIRAEKDKAGGLKFSITIEDFIDCYNGYYRRDNGNLYIQPYSEWYSYEQDFGKYKGDIHYEFTADKKKWTLPTIIVYTPKNGKKIRELTVNFDDHCYTDIMYKQYEELCFYTLRVFFPTWNKQKIIRLYKKMNKLAYKNIFQKGQGFHSGNPPHDLYYQNGVGVYPYFAYGECVRLCVIPVTPKVIQSYKAKGTLIHQK